MSISRSLSTKILLLALLNLGLLLAAFGVFLRLQLRDDFGSFFMSPARDRLIGIGRLVELELQQNPPEKWNELLARHGREHAADVYLFANPGHQFGGPPITLPDAVLRRMRPGGGPPRGGPGGGGPLRGEPRSEQSGPPPGPLRRERSLPPPQQPVFVQRAGDPVRYWIGVRIPVPAGDGMLYGGTLLLSFPTLLGNDLLFDYKPMAAVVLVVLAISVCCWLPLIRSLTRSITQLTGATERIAEGQFDVVVDEDRRDELGKLGAAINRLAQRLQSFVAGQKRFLGDIAHELTSPIARIQVATGILEQRSGEPARPYIEDLREEVQQMSSLVHELLSFSKAGMDPKTVELVPLNVAEMVGSVLEREAAGRSEVHTSVDTQLSVVANPEYLSRALSNLVRNAVRYAGSAGPISITAAATNGNRNGEQDITIVVSDCGPGVPESEIENIFSPFYRPEAARTRETGGVGLGLAIVKTCVEICQGTIACRNRRPSGLEVSVRLRRGP